MVGSYAFDCKDADVYRVVLEGFPHRIHGHLDG